MGETPMRDLPTSFADEISADGISADCLTTRVTEMGDVPIRKGYLPIPGDKY